MRTIERFGRFKRDYKREKKGQHAKTLDADLIPIIEALASDEPLEPRHRDHALTDKQREQGQILLCVSRAKADGGKLVLDL